MKELVHSVSDPNLRGTKEKQGELMILILAGKLKRSRAQLNNYRLQKYKTLEEAPYTVYYIISIRFELLIISM